MRRPKKVAHVVIITGMLVLIPDDETNRSPCRFPLKHTTQQFYLIWLLSACSDTALSRASAIQFLLDECNIYRNPCWHSVNDASNSLPVAFSEGRQSEYLSECITHGNVRIHNLRHNHSRGRDGNLRHIRNYLSDVLQGALFPWSWRVGFLKWCP